MNRSLSILGSTGSIGRQALDVAKTGNYKIKALTANGNVELLEKQIRESLLSWFQSTNKLFLLTITI